MTDDQPQVCHRCLELERQISLLVAQLAAARKEIARLDERLRNRPQMDYHQARRETQ